LSIAVIRLIVGLVIEILHFYQDHTFSTFNHLAYGSGMVIKSGLSL